ncbi:YbaK/EbsC family protein [Vibrio tapetis subsp. quintayensis]|uniref:aminoacyl-tRNA deacylase n=1 Tax=Vibrio tapetis TaxID=52443 RepID=UPI0025B49B2C|nr:YbaK/EbsC family protein [Vibrio tapetis]MDN3681699.1 YbaK/EbsC family protein [Vibrio tapetis subsp. quintayensis]
MSNTATSITQYLEKKQVSYRLLPHKTPATSIEDAALQRKCRPEQMVKSILLRDMGNQYALACVPGNRQVDPKKVRAELNCRRMTCVSSNELLEITGYEVGCVAPITLSTQMPIVFDFELLKQNEVTISSGSNMAGIALKLEDLLALCSPVISNIVRDL